MSAIRAFKEPYLVSDTIQDETDFGNFDARCLRYSLYWSYYENSAYRDLVHKWAHAYKVQYGLYRHIRSIYNPAYRLGEFWKNHLWGGALDVNAGDGKSAPSALPILTENPKLPPAIALVWKNSNWQVKKDVFTLWGSVLGDVGLKVVDDPTREKTYLKIVHPGTIKSLDLDPFGNVKGYELEEIRDDPSNSDRKCTYREVATRDGINVVYRTYKNNDLFSWDEDEPEWAEPYGFIPFVFVKHNDVGLDWGWSEFHSDHPKFREVDDIASKTSDQIRKMVDSGWLLAGIQNPKREKVKTEYSSNTRDTEAEREEVPVLYGPTGATATPLVSNLDISATATYLEKLLKVIEADYPELIVNTDNSKGDVSGRALRINQEPIETKVGQRRPNYDNGLVRAQQMAIAIGGFRKYPGFEGFNLESFVKGDLDHQIGDRPVFAKDPTDDLEQETVFWNTAKAALANGIPLTVFLKTHGWSDDKIKLITDSPEFIAKLSSLRQISMIGGDNGVPNEGQETE